VGEKLKGRGRRRGQMRIGKEENIGGRFAGEEEKSGEEATCLEREGKTSGVF